MTSQDVAFGTPPYTACDPPQGLKNSDALRAAVDAVQDDNTRINTKISQSKPLYRAFSQLRAAGNLTEAQTRILDGVLLTAKVSGVDIQVAFPALCMHLQWLRFPYS